MPMKQRRKRVLESDQGAWKTAPFLAPRATVGSSGQQTPRLQTGFPKCMVFTISYGSVSTICNNKKRKKKYKAKKIKIDIFISSNNFSN